MSQRSFRARPVHDTDGMGLNPFRPQQHRATDVLFVVAAVLVTLGLLAWALFA